jgi:TusA-related sulfurtransferase
MKTFIAVLILGVALPMIGQSDVKPTGPKYNAAAESVYKGTVADLRNRECPVSGSMGAHIILKLQSGETIEVHLATTEFTKMMEMNLQKGVPIEVTGWKTEFEGVQTILAREVKYGNETYVFRAKDGMPVWVY